MGFLYIHVTGDLVENIYDKIKALYGYEELAGLSRIEFPYVYADVRPVGTDNPALKTVLLLATRFVRKELESIAERNIEAYNAPMLAAVLLAATLKAGVNPSIVTVTWEVENYEWPFEGDYTLSEMAVRYFINWRGIIGKALASLADEEVMEVTSFEPSQMLRWAARVVRQLTRLDWPDARPLAWALINWIALVVEEIAGAYGVFTSVGVHPSATITESFREALSAAEALGDADAKEYVEALIEAYETLIQELQELNRLASRASHVISFPNSPDVLEEAAGLLEEAASKSEQYEKKMDRIAEKARNIIIRLNRKAKAEGPFLTRGTGHATAKI